MMDRPDWWDTTERVNELSVRRLCDRVTVTIDETDSRVSKVESSFVGMDDFHIFAGYNVVLSDGRRAMLYSDGDVHDDDDLHIGSWKLVNP